MKIRIINKSKYELPAGYEARIRPVSGLAINKGVKILNSPGTIWIKVDDLLETERGDGGFGNTGKE